MGAHQTHTVGFNVVFSIAKCDNGCFISSHVAPITLAEMPFFGFPNASETGKFKQPAKIAGCVIGRRRSADEVKGTVQQPERVFLVGDGDDHCFV